MAATSLLPGAPLAASSAASSADSSTASSTASPATDPLPARSETAAAARASASGAAEEVDALVGQVESITAELESSDGDFADGVRREVLAVGAESRAVRAMDAASASQRTRVSALYRSGGPQVLVASLLGARDVSDLLHRAQTSRYLMRSVVDAGTSDAASASREARASARARTTAEGQTQAAIATARDLDARAADLDAVLADARAKLDALRLRAQTLADAEEAAAQLAAARAAAARLAEAEAAARAAQHRTASAVTAIGIPADAQAAYVAAAATCRGMRWTMLAAVGQVESRHGATNGPSSAGAVGPMQFMPATFAAYGVDGDGDRVADPWNLVDAVFSAARYLCANGAGAGTPQGDHDALWHYNHAEWYVTLVLGVEADIAARLPAAPL